MLSHSGELFILFSLFVIYFLLHRFYILSKGGIFLQHSILLDVSLNGLPPTVNHSYSSHGKFRYKTFDCKNYQKLTTQALRLAWNNREPYPKPVQLFITFITNDHKRWDIDNRVKTLQDCLNLAGIIKDDSQINLLHVERSFGDTKSTHLILKEFSQ